MILPLTRTITRIEVTYSIPRTQQYFIRKYCTFNHFTDLIDKAKKELNADITNCTSEKIYAVVYSQDCDLRLQIMIEKWIDVFVEMEKS